MIDGIIASLSGKRSITKEKSEHNGDSCRSDGKLNQSIRNSLRSYNKVSASRRVSMANIPPEPTVEELLEDPIGCGFLLRHCKLHFSDENVNFIIDVNRYRELLNQLDSDGTFWPVTSYLEVDKNFEVLAAHDPNISLNDTFKDIFLKMEKRAINYSTFQRLCGEAEELVRYIQDTYLVDASQTQICMSTKVRENTFRRMKQLALYGPEVFGETCIDPILTLVKDILPRFLRSESYITLKRRRKECVTLPSATELVVQPPDVDLNMYTAEDTTPTRRFGLLELLKEGFLYNEFLDYCKSRVSTEGLLCFRMIEIYEQAVAAEEAAKLDKSLSVAVEIAAAKDAATTEAEEIAWKIFKFFISPGSAYEISCTTLDRNDVMRSLATPHRGMFENMKKTVHLQLSNTLQQYGLTADYKNLGIRLKEYKEATSLKQKPAGGIASNVMSSFARPFMKSNMTTKVAAEQ